MTLTEQWRKGELPEGFYYVDDGAEVTIDYYLCDYWERHFDSDVHQVLAPVPSYEECQKLKERVQGLECELLEVINVLLKVSPEHEEWINMNFPNYKRGEL